MKIILKGTDFIGNDFTDPRDCPLVRACKRTLGEENVSANPCYVSVYENGLPSRFYYIKGTYLDGKRIDEGSYHHLLMGQQALKERTGNLEAILPKDSGVFDVASYDMVKSTFNEFSGAEAYVEIEELIP